MVKISDALKAKSDQLNALDLVGSPLTIVIERVDYHHGKEQPVEIFYHGSKLPWRAAKCMLRLLSSYWSDETENWVGKTVELYFEQNVMWAGKADGGIRVSGLSDIEKTEQVRVKEGRNKHNIYNIKKLSPATILAANEPSQKILDAIQKCVDEVNLITDIAQITDFMEGQKYQWAKKQQPDLLKLVDNALENKENELKAGVENVE